MQRHFDRFELGTIELFCLAAELGGFTPAATAAGVTPAAVSRSIGRLETRLGVRLFVRTTRHMRLTDAGQRYFERCQQALIILADAEREVGGEQLQAAGRVRISVPTTYGHYRVLPLLAGFCERYPNVLIDLNISNRNIDFAEEGYDLSIRARALVDSSLIARKLEDAEVVVVASSRYLAHAGIPVTLQDLRQHQCIQFELPSSGKRIPWMFREGGEDIDFFTAGNLCCSEDVLAGVTLAVNGAGVFQTFRFIAERYLRSGELVEILQPLGGRTRVFSLLYAHGQHLPLRVRVFIQYLVESLEKDRRG